MRLTTYITTSLLTLILLTATAGATPIAWALNGVALSDGGTATGSFTFDPTAGTPCGSFGPCGTYSNVHIVTTGGADLPGATYSSTCGEDVATCTGVSPDSTEVMFLTSNAADQTGASAIALFFTGIGVFPPNGLTSAGGTINISGSSSAVGILTEASCSDASCAAPSAPSRMSTAGSVTEVPEPASWLLLLGSFALIASVRAAPGAFPVTRK